MNCFTKLFYKTSAKPADKVEPVVIVPVAVKDPVRAAPSGEKTLCIDVSHWKSKLDWKKAFEGGVRLMHTKATEGLTNVDRTMRAHCEAARAAGVLIGVYHFFHASMDGKKQAAHFLKAVEGMHFDAPHVLDWESQSADGMPSGTQKIRALDWLNVVEKATGRVPWIYGGEAFLRELKLGPEFAKYPLWLAHYQTTEAKLKIPAPWKRYTAWQYTDGEKIAGNSNQRFDASWFNGSVEELKIELGVKS